jgi:hypothetical protein
MVAHQVLVEVLRAEAAVAGAVQRLNLRLAFARYPLGPDLPQTSVKQPGLARVVKPDAPAAKRPLGDAEQRCGVDLVELVGFITVEYTPEFDHPHTL